MKTVLTLKDGRREYITKEEDFREFIHRELGLDALECFDDILEDNRIDESVFSSDPAKYCPFQGECDRVYETQRHYETILKDVQEEIGSWALFRLTKEQIVEKRDELWEKINREL